MALANGNVVQDMIFLEGDGSLTGFNVSSLQYPGQLGHIFRDGQYEFQVVQLASGSADLTAGTTAYWNASDGADFVVHKTDQTKGVAGEAAGAITAGNYGLVKRVAWPGGASQTPDPV